jgi:phage FluMu protein Com
MNLGKCPHCETLMTNVNVEDVSIDVASRPQWKGFSYYCPRCKKVLSVQINPLTVEADTAGKTAAQVKKHLATLQDEIGRKIDDIARKRKR